MDPLHAAARDPADRAGTSRLPTRCVGVSCFVLSLLVTLPARTADHQQTAWDAQPGLHRVGFAEATDPALAVTAGYGFTEPLTDDDGAHHRLSSRLAGAIAPLSWLNVAAMFDARYDKHWNDDGAVIDVALAARAFTAVSDTRLGLELRPWLPGAEDPSTAFDALSLDSRLLFDVDLGTVRVATTAGYRLDRTAASGEDASRLSFSDRVAIGVSDFDAVLVGAGVAVPVGSTELLAEASGDILVGAGAPSVTESPLRAGGGVRHHLSKRLAAELVVSASLSARPDVSPGSSLVPIEPRVSVLAGIRYRLTSPEPQASAPGRPTTPETAQPIPPPPAKPTDTTFELVVLDDQGQPLGGAKLALTIAGTTRELASDAAGRYADEHAALGPGEVSVAAEGFEPLRRQFVLEAGVPLEIELKLTALPPQSQLRGVIRSFGGQGLAARVRVEPLGVEVTTNADGAFQVDVPPGDYEVAIQAVGYDTQKRRVRVDPQGVVILNADLVKSRAKR
ncbi:MAG TPA: carboxypeptidase regulatory-like domain-containing protein [Polyangiaceae bacterium]